MDSILTSIKKMLGPGSDDNNFDVDIIIHINSAIMLLRKMGVGPEEGFSITSDEETWDEYLGEQMSKLQAVKTYIYIKVKLIFDPPANSFVLNSLNEEAKRLEFYLNVEADTEV